MMQRLDILPGPGQPSGCVPETITQSKPVLTPKKSAQSAPRQKSAQGALHQKSAQGTLRRKIAESGEVVSVAELDPASRKPSTVAGDAAHLAAGPPHTIDRE